MHRIALDWGSSHLRAYAVDTCGAVLQTRQADTGVFSVVKNEFELTLRALVDDWLDAHPQIEICAAGMIGSANGWQEARYVCTPATPRALRESMLRIAFERSAHVLQIIPGVRHGAGMAVDVMRGEETQIFGVLQGLGDGVFCLPGTHCKWVVVRDDAIVDFRTHFTGELYQWLSTQSSVSKVFGPTAPFDSKAFDEAAGRAIAAPGDLLHQLFTLRASVVSRERDGAWAASAAQGALIGADVANGIEYLRRSFGDFASAPIHLIGAPTLSAHYAHILGQQDIDYRMHDADATVNGLTRICGKPA